MISLEARPFRLLAGLAIGLIAGMTIEGRAQVLLGEFLRPIGGLWLDALTMTVVPLVFGLLVSGTTMASRSAVAGGTTMRAMLLFAVMLSVAALTAAGLSEALLRLWPAGSGLAGLEAAAPPAPSSPADWYRSIIPTNPIKAAAEMAMVPLIVFSLFFGFALARLEAEAADAILNPLRAMVDAMLVIVGWVLAVAPIGIAALAFDAGAKLGASALGALGLYIVVVVAACLAATALAYVWAAAAGGTSLLRFVRAALPVQAVALGTQSSLATLPVMVEAADQLGIAKERAAIVLPLAVALFRAASVAANVAVAVYLAHMHHVPLGVGALVLAAMIAVPVSLGAVGLPAQVSFFATIGPVCMAVGVPVAALPLLLAIEAIPDLFRTLGNVTHDLAAASAIERWSNDAEALD